MDKDLEAKLYEAITVTGHIYDKLRIAGAKGNRLLALDAHAILSNLLDNLQKGIEEDR